MTSSNTTATDTAAREGTATIGVTGLAVMGRNLARNFARHGYTVALHNRTAAQDHALVERVRRRGRLRRRRRPPRSSSPSLERPRAGWSSW